ncbi:MAG: nucleoside hydrolase [Oscillospiraceae bacterium]|nr:nucleoside hydrolase [Oscillospiraceae bacterium]
MEDNMVNIIVDTDCGSDDAVAIAMALNDPNVNILMATICAGNVPVQQAAINCLTTIEWSKSYEFPVYIGCENMLMGPLDFSPKPGRIKVHGEDGMGDLGLLPKRLKVSEGNAIFKMCECLRENPENTIEIVTLGPLTNIAVAMRYDPEAMKRVKRISIMGSAGLGTGNVSPVAEANIWHDAEAAKIVLEFGVPLMFVGWDACLGDAMLEKDELDRLSAAGPLGKFSVDINRFLIEADSKRFGRPCFDMADPAAMAAAIYPECIEEAEDFYCQMDISHGPSHGSLIVDKFHFSPNKPNACICSKLKADVYKEYVFRTLSGK